MMPMDAAEVAQATGGRLAVPDGAEGHAVATSAVSDSRQVGPGAVFVAIRGERTDGHEYVAQAARAGAAMAVVDHEVDAPVAQVVVGDTVTALGALAAHNLVRRRQADGPFDVVGLTGSVGKTTTKDLLASLLGSLGPTVAPVGSFNNEIGLPLTVLQVGPRTRHLVAEMGANHEGEIARLTRIAPPDVAIVLKVGVAHLGEFGSVEGIARAKSEIVRGLRPSGLAVLNADDPHVAAMEGLAPGRVAWFGMTAGRRGGMTARDVTVDGADRASFLLVDADGTTAPVTLSIPGRHNVMNALAAAATARQLGMGLDEVARGLSSVSAISPHRMAVGVVRRGETAFTLIDDSFNANPDSMDAGLDALAATAPSDGTRPFRVAVLGAMLELGPDESDLHRQVGAYAAGKGIDAVVAVGGADPHLRELAGDLAEGARRAGAPLVVEAASADDADGEVGDLAARHPGTIVLLKGSHASGLSSLAQRWAPETSATGPNGRNRQ